MFGHGQHLLMLVSAFGDVSRPVGILWLASIHFPSVTGICGSDQFISFGAWLFGLIVMTMAKMMALVVTFFLFVAVLFFLVHGCSPLSCFLFDFLLIEASNTVVVGCGRNGSSGRNGGSVCGSCCCCVFVFVL